MKKKIIIISLTAVVLLLVVAVLIFKPWIYIGDHTNAHGIVYEDIDASEAILRVCRKEDIKQIEDTFGLKTVEWEGKQFFEDVECFGYKMDFSYRFDSEGSLLELNSYGNFLAESSNIMSKCVDLVKKFSGFFGVEVSSDCFIYTDSTMLDVSQESSYQMIFDGQAVLEFRVRDSYDSFWALKIQRTNSENIFLTIDRYVGDERYADIVANIDLT